MHIVGMVGGQGGVYGGSDWQGWHAGSGGTGGKGGNINVSTTATILAYNGDANTNGDHTQLIPDVTVTMKTWTTYNKKISETVQSTTNYLQNVDVAGKTITPAKIIAQTGICRETYFVNHEGNTYQEDLILATYSSLCNNCLNTEAKTVASYKQGIGSGAGYIEISNGSYKINGVEQMR